MNSQKIFLKIAYKHVGFVLKADLSGQIFYADESIEKDIVVKRL